MFTGIIEEIGTVARITKKNASAHITIRAHKMLADLKLGDSIAVNGCCLTIVDFNEHEFTADVMNETLSKTNLKGLTVNSRVNLERALRLGDRLGGHVVTGHIDCVGIITKIKEQDIATLFTIRVTERGSMKYIVSKGSVAIDGTSLTVVNAGIQDFSVSLIPHTKDLTVLGSKRAGDLVNLEVDILGKYIERLLEFKKHDDNLAKKSENGVTYDVLNKYGFL